MNQYDVIIIGAGPGGIFSAYELLEKKSDLKVLMIEKGRSIEKRNCRLLSLKYIRLVLVTVRAIPESGRKRAG